MEHKPDCRSLDPYAHLLGSYGLCNCGAEAQPPETDGDRIARVFRDGSRQASTVHRYLVVNRRSGFEHQQSFAGIIEARDFARHELDEIGAPVELYGIDNAGEIDTFWSIRDPGLWCSIDEGNGRRAAELIAAIEAADRQ